jgi:eukaryotic-like serine/threonine-protein kinase
MGFRDRVRTLLRLFLLSTVLVTVALVSAITTIRLTIHGRQETVPKLVGMQLERAQQIMTTLGMDVKVEDKIFNAQFPAGTIVSQEPEAGTRVKEGQHIHTLVSLGPPQITIPNLVGASLRAARITAIQRGLAVGDVAAINAPEAEPDQVLAQDPPPNTTQVRSPTVNLLVALGPAPAAYVCPNFIGRALPDARQVIEKAGMKVGQITPIPTDAAARGTILNQTPPPGSKINAEATLDFEVAQPGGATSNLNIVPPTSASR